MSLSIVEVFKIHHSLDLYPFYHLPMSRLHLFTFSFWRFNIDHVGEFGGSNHNLCKFHEDWRVEYFFII